MWKITGPRIRRGKRYYWECTCSCGAVGVVVDSAVKAGSCCRECHYKARVKHGHNKSNTGTYQSWKAMRSRCNNPNASNYANYGGLGVKICPQWEDFEVFLKDMGERPGGTTLDRINAFGDYEPGNCRWATAKEQSNNQRRYYEDA